MRSRLSRAVLSFTFVIVSTTVFTGVAHAVPDGMVYTRYEEIAGCDGGGGWYVTHYQGSDSTTTLLCDGGN